MAWAIPIRTTETTMASTAAVAAAARPNPTAMTQPRHRSLLEVAANLVVGAAINLIVQVVAFPWFGIEVALRTNLGITLLFTGISMARSYVMRRLFNQWDSRKNN